MALDIDRFSHIVSPIQRWDPRFKVAALGGLALMVALIKTLPVAIAAIAIAMAILAISTLPLHFISHGLSFVLVFLLPFFVIMPFTYPGDGAFELLGLPFAWEGLRLAALIFIKALTIVLLSFSIFGTSRFDVSMLALQHLRIPKVIVQMLLFTYRYTYVFLEEMRRMHTSMRARGFVPGSNRRTLKVYGHFIGTLLVRSFERTERVYKAMLSKGYQGELHSLMTFSAVPSDYMKLLLVALIAVVLVALDHSGLWPVAEQAWF